MHKSIRISIITLSCFLTSIYAVAQCPYPSAYVSITASDTVICLGDSVIIYPASGVAALSENFNDLNLDNEFLSNYPPQLQTYTNPCGPGLDGSPHFWFGPALPAPRNLETIDFNLTGGGFIAFDFKMSEENITAAAPCEGPDQANEGISLQYSTDAGVTWIDTVYFSPTGVIMVSNPGTPIPGTNGPTPFTTWANYSFPIPFGARVPCVRFRWYQITSSQNQNDHWGLDNLFIGDTTNSVTVTQAYYPLGNPFGYPVDTAFYIYPTQDTTLILAIDTGTAPNIATMYDTVSINVIPVPDAELTFSAPRCAGDSIHFSVTPKGSNYVTDYDLNSTGGFDYFNAAEDTSFVYIIPGTYSVRIRVTALGAGCFNIDTFQLDVYAVPQLNLQSLPTTVCQGTPFAFNANASILNPPSQNSTLDIWDWDFDGNGSTDSTGGSSIDSIGYVYTQPGTYTVYVTVTTNHPCMRTDSIQVVVLPAPSANFVGGNDCSDALIQFNDSSSASTGQINQWSWTFTNSTNFTTTSNTQNPLIQFPGPGSYTATLVVVTDSGCVDTITKNFSVFPLPVADFSYNAKCFGIVDFMEQVTNGTGNMIYTWDLQNDQFPDTNAAIFTYQYDNIVNDTTVQVHFSVVDANGCSSDTTKSVMLKGGIDTLIMPNLLVVNSTVAGNDELNFQTFAQGFNQCVDYTLRIYNRWGNLVFETQNQSTAPDLNCTDCFVGKTGSGATLNEGTYYYVLLGTDIDGGTYEKAGVLQIVHAY